MDVQRIVRKAIRLLPVLLLFCFIAKDVASDPTRDWIPGVAKDDFCFYQTYGIFNSTNHDARIDVPLFEQNTTDWVRVDITGVSGSVICQAYTLHFKNGTETKFEKKTDVDQTHLNTMNFSRLGIPICASNLDVGDTIPTVKIAVNDTQTRNYLTAERITLHFSWKTSEDWGDCYFDRKTGVLVELYRVHRFTNPVTGETTDKADVVRLTRTNLWTANEILSMAQIDTLVALALIDATVCIVPIGIIGSKKKKNPGALSEAS